MENKKAIIPIYINKYEEKIISNLTACIEEEGILYEIFNIQDNRDLLKLAQSNVNDFMLQSTIAVDKNKMYFFNSKYKKELFKKEITSIEDTRIFGSNCARYIKGYPFKEVV